MSSETELEADRTRKILVLTILRADYALLEEMLAAACQKIPALDMDGMISAIITEACRHARANASIPSLP